MGMSTKSLAPFGNQIGGSPSRLESFLVKMAIPYESQVDEIAGSISAASTSLRLIPRHHNDRNVGRRRPAVLRKQYSTVPVASNIRILLFILTFALVRACIRLRRHDPCQCSYSFVSM